MCYGIIYKTTNLVNGKIYVGQTTMDDENYLGSGSVLLQAVKKYGRKNFKRETLRECENQRELDIWEHVYIKKLHSQDDSVGYNILPGTSYDFGSGSPAKIPSVQEKMPIKMQERLASGWKPEHRLTSEHYEKHSKRMREYFQTHEHWLKGRKIEKEKHSMFGKHHSEESKLKMSRNHADVRGENNPFFDNHTMTGDKNPFFGHHHTEEVKRKQSEVMKEYYRTHDNPWKGKHREITEEQKKKQSESMKSKIWITNGVDNKRVNVNEVIPDGWKRGKTNH